MTDSYKSQVVLRGTSARGAREAVRECMQACDWESGQDGSYPAEYLPELGYEVAADLAAAGTTPPDPRPRG